MKFTMEDLEKFSNQLLAAKTPEEVTAIAGGLGYEVSAKEAEDLYAAMKKGEREGKIEDALLRNVSGGESPDIPQYETIREYYRLKGPNPALVLCIYFIPSPICYEIIQVLEKEEAQKAKK